MKVSELSISGPKLIHTDKYFDNRGSFRETFNTKRYGDAIPHHDWVQTNHSVSKMGVLRGLHAQFGQAKLVSVITGVIMDVVVDIRMKSQTFGKWESVFITPENQLYIPPGFAHGFLSLSDNTNVLYQVSTVWDPELEFGIKWNDPDIDVKWMIEDPLMSDKDKYENMSLDEYAHSRYLPDDV